MATVTNPTALTIATIPPGVGASVSEQNGDTTNGNKFANGAGVRLLVRNTTAGAIGVDFFADVFGSEVKVIDGSITANKVSANGQRVFGPFDPALFNVHAASITGTSAEGAVVIKQTSGSAGDLKFCPFITMHV